jgi:cell pole-organizing protein PopZ
MSNAAKAHEPTMEEILASIRRIIADDEPAAAEAKPAAAAPKAAAAAPAPVAKAAAAPAPAAEPEAAAELGQDDIDAMLASFDSPAVPDKADAPAAAPAPKDEDVLELTKPVAKPGADAEEDVEFREPKAAAAEPEPEMDAWAAAEAMEEEEAAPPPPAPKPVSAAAMMARDPGETLLGQEPGNAVHSAFSSLAHTILAQNARTLDDLVQEMLRPMLKSWLDDNLPTIVERLVRAEIERVSRGPRR